MKMKNLELVPHKTQKFTLSTKAKRRMRTTREETEILERFYSENPNPNNEQKIKIAELVQMGPKNVHFWFQNRRAKDKKMQKLNEKNASHNKKSFQKEVPQVLTEDNRLPCKKNYERLLAEQKQLEKLKRTLYQKAAAQLPPISSLFGQKKFQKEEVGLDIPFAFHHSIHGIEASVEQWIRASKNRVGSTSNCPTQ